MSLSRIRGTRCRRGRRLHHGHQVEYLLHRSLYSYSACSPLTPAMAPDKPDDEPVAVDTAQDKRCCCRLFHLAVYTLKPTFRLLLSSNMGDRVAGLKDMEALMPPTWQPRTTLAYARIQQEEFYPKVGKVIADTFEQFGGVNMVVEMLLEGCGNLTSWPRFFDRERGKVRGKEMRHSCLDLLVKLALRSPSLAAQLRDHQDLIKFCMYLLTCDELHEPACKLIELMLSVKQRHVKAPTFLLRDIPNLREIVDVTGSPGSHNFFRLLSLIIDPDLDLDVDGTRTNQKKLDSSKKSNHVNFNMLFSKAVLHNGTYCSLNFCFQEFLLQMPEFLDHLIDVALDEPYAPRTVNAGLREVEHWARLIDDSISDEIGAESVSGEGGFQDKVLNAEKATVVRAEVSSHESSDCDVASRLLSHLQALHLLNTLLSGDLKSTYQDVLSARHIVVKMTELFDQFKWHFTGDYFACAIVFLFKMRLNTQ